MERFLNFKCDANSLSPLTLAFIGDAVFTLLVREEMVCAADSPVSVLHNQSTKRVNAAAQSQAVGRILPHLTEEEAAVLRRGRNAHTSGTPKNVSCSDYHRATGLESLFGYLYLKGDFERIRQLYSLISGGE